MDKKPVVSSFSNPLILDTQEVAVAIADSKNEDDYLPKEEGVLIEDRGIVQNKPEDNHGSQDEKAPQEISKLEEKTLLNQNNTKDKQQFEISGTYLTPISITDTKNKGVRFWKFVFGEMYCIASYILASKISNEASKAANETSSVLIHCDGIELGEVQKKQIRWTYKFFVELFKKNEINANILIDAGEEIVGTIDARITKSGKVTRLGKGNKSVVFITSKDANNDIQKKYEPGIPKNELTKETVKLLSNNKKILDFSKEITVGLSCKIKKSLKEKVNKFKQIVDEGFSIILTLRREGFHDYDSEHNAYYCTTKQFISHIIQSLCKYNEGKESNKCITNIFIVGMGYNDDKFFGENAGITPNNFIANEVKKHNIKCKFFESNYYEKIYDDENIEFLVQAYYYVLLKEEFNIVFAIGPYSGITHALASFGISIVFPTYTEKRFDIKDSNYHQINLKEEVLEMLKPLDVYIVNNIFRMETLTFIYFQNAMIKKFSYLIAKWQEIYNQDKIIFINECATGNELCVTKLLEKNKALALVMDFYGCSPLMHAVIGEHNNIIKLLLKSTCNSNINHQNKAGDTALILAGRHNLFNVLPLLLEAGSDSNIKNKDGETVSILAKKRGYKKFILAPSF